MTWSFARRLSRALIAYTSCFALTAQSIAPALAQAITPDAGAPPAYRPSTDAAPNGVPIVNITRPNDSGLSHNKYTDFNVGVPGVVLNNSSSTGRSVLGGQILGNPNLANSAAARTILNEVTSTNPSVLNGYLEVFGASADVIVANPNGITCNGCGFINTPRATLSTGVPYVNPITGAFESLSVERGVVTVGELGLDARSVDYFDIVARSVQINGAVHGKDVGVFAGRNDFDYLARSVMAKADDGSGKPTWAIDSSLLGGMYANKIALTATEKGVGVKAPPRMSATGDRISITADGRLVIGRTTAGGKIRAVSKAASVDVKDTVVGRSGVEISAGDGIALDQSVVVASAVDVALTAAGDITAAPDVTVRAGLNPDDGTITNGTGRIAVDAGSDVAIDQTASLASGDAIDLTVGGTLSNAGVVQSGGDVTADANRIDNTGTLAAVGGLTVDSASQLTNASGASLRAEGDVRLSAATTLQNAGALQSGRNVVADANRFDNTGSITARDGLTVASASLLTNAQGASLIAAGDLSLNAATALQNAGTITAGQNVDIVTPGITTTATSEIISGADLRLASASSLSITGGGPFQSVGNFSIVSVGDLSLAAGLYKSFASLDVQGASITNAGTLEAETTARLESTTGGITNSSSVASNDGLTVVTATSLSNTGSLTSVAGVDISIGTNLTNSATGSIASGETLAIAAGGNISNAGTLGTPDVLILEAAGNITNTGLVFAGTDASIWLNGTLTNNGGDIISDGDLVIAGLDQYYASALTNSNGGLIEAGRDLDIAVDTVSNLTQAPVIGVVTQISTSGPTVVGGGDYTETTTVTTQVDTETVTQRFPPAQLLAGRNLTIDATTITNDYSQIAAGGDVTLTGNTLTNTARDLIETTTVTSTTNIRHRYCADRIFGVCVNHKTDYRTISNSDVSTALTGEKIFASIEAGGQITGDFTGRIDNQTIRGGAGQVGLSSQTFGAPGSVAGTPPPTLDPGTLQGTLIANLASHDQLFQAAPDPASRFLFETRAQFIDPGVFFGSDYFFDRMGGYDPDNTVKRLGDAYFETRLVRDQLFALTGRRFTAGEIDDAALMQALYDNAVDEAKALNLTPGIKLTEAQIGQLRHDIIWLETIIVDGQEVLAPRVYLRSGPRQTNEVASAAGLIGDSVALTAKSIGNSGGIGAADVLVLQVAENLENIGGTISGGRVDILADDTFLNLSGTVQGRSVSIAADQVVNSTAVTRDTYSNGYADRRHQTGEIIAEDTLTVTANRDIISEGGRFASGGDTSLDAGGDIVLSAIAGERQREDTFKTGYDKAFSRLHEAASVEAGGDVNINAGGSIDVIGSRIGATGDTALVAGDGITIASVQDIDSRESTFKVKGGGFLSTKIDESSTSQSTTNRASEITSEGNLSLEAKTGDVTVDAAKLESGGTTELTAEQGKVALLTDTDSEYKQEKSRNEDAFWWDSRDQGSYTETTRHVEITAGGGLKIKAGGGVIAEIEAKGSLDASIAALSEKPGLSWTRDLQQRNDVTWQKVEAAAEQWDHKAQGLTEAGAALVALAVTVASAGTLSQLSATLAAALPAGLQGAATTAAINAGLNQLVTSASISLINNQGDLGKTLKELGSSENLRSLATAVVTAGLVAGITEVSGLGKPLAANATLAERTTQALQRNLIRATVSSAVSTVIEGGDLDDKLLASLRSGGVNALLGAVQTKIGDLTDGVGAKDLPVANMLAHAVAGGLAAEAAGGDFKAGAAAALASAVAANADLFTGLSKDQVSGVIQLLGGVAAVIASDGDADAVNQGAAIAESAALNNYLTHANVKDMTAELKACQTKVGGCSESEQIAIAQKWAAVALQNDKLLAATCADLACVDQALSQAVQWYSAEASALRDLSPTAFNILHNAYSFQVLQPALDQVDRNIAFKTEYDAFAAANCAGLTAAACGDAFLVAWENVNNKLAFAEKTKLVLSVVLTGGAAAAAVAPKAVQLIKSCVANPVCWNEVGIAVGDLAAGDALGGGTLAVSVVGGKLAVSKAGEIVDLIDDKLGRLVPVEGAATDLYRAADGSIYKLDEVGQLVPTSRTAANRVAVSDIGELRPPARPLLEGEDALIGSAQGLQSRTAGTFDNVVQGTHGDRATTYLYTIDDRGVNIALETTPAATPRGNIVHTNISDRAVIGGEAWFGPNNTVTINAGSGRFGDGAGITQQQWDNTVRYWEGLGYTVNPIPFGSR